MFYCLPLPSSKEGFDTSSEHLVYPGHAVACPHGALTAAAKLGFPAPLMHPSFQTHLCGGIKFSTPQDPVWGQPADSSPFPYNHHS